MLHFGDVDIEDDLVGEPIKQSKRDLGPSLQRTRLEVELQHPSFNLSFESTYYVP